MIEIKPDIYAENQLLNAILKNNHIIDDFQITAELFHDRENKSIFSAISHYFEKGKPVTVESLTHLYTRQLLNITPAKLAGLNPFSAANAAHYVNILKNIAKLEKISNLKLWLEDQTAGNPDEILENLQRHVSEITSPEDAGIVTSRQLTTEFLMNLEALKRGEKSPFGIPTGFDTLDRLSYGFLPGEFVILAARTSAGKSTLSVQILTYQAVLCQHTVGFISMEMDLSHLQAKIISNLSNIKLSQLKLGFVSDAEYEQAVEAGAKLYIDNLLFFRAKNTSLQHIKSKIRQMARMGAKVVYVDYLTLISYPDRHLSRPERVGLISKELKLLAEELGIAVVVLSQLNRAAANGEASLATIRQSGEVEEDADKILLLNREIGSRDAELHLAKHRTGPTGKINLYFEEEFQRFIEKVD